MYDYKFLLLKEDINTWFVKLSVKVFLSVMINIILYEYLFFLS